MCGIAAFFSPDNHPKEWTHSLINRMVKRMEHRGPDEGAIMVGDNVGFGHTRLSINGLSNGRQPIVGDDVIIVVNGEFYDHKSIRSKYEPVPYDSSKWWTKRIGNCPTYNFTTDSDSEILIPLYREYGAEGMMKHLNGEFAFVLYDLRKNLMVVGRDRFGIKPLCYRRKGNDFEFASEPKCFDGLELDETSVLRAAASHYQALDRTFYKGIRQVKPGHLMFIDESGCREYKYWDIDYSKVNEKWEDENTVGRYKEGNYPIFEEGELACKMRRAILRRTRESDVPICAHLSGGIDSTVAMSASAHYYNNPMTAFSVVFPDSPNGVYNEQDIIRRTISHMHKILPEFPANLVEIPVSKREIIDNLFAAVRGSDSVAVNGHISCKYLLNKAIRERGFKVALTGEGADECFLGYSHLRNDLNGGFDLSRSENAIMHGTETPDGEMLNTSEIRAALGYVPSFLQAKFSMGHKFQGLLADGVKLPNVSRMLVEELNLENLKTKSRAETSAYIWCKSALPNYILRTLGDGCEMPHSIEGRLPFLDYELFEYVAALPTEAKFMTGIEKFPLRQFARPFVTEEIYARRKQPFQAPPITTYFMEKDWNETRDMILNSGLDMFDGEKVDKMLSFVKNSNNETTHVVYEPIIMLLMSMAALNNSLKR